MKTATLEEWQAIGAQSKKIRKELIYLLNQSKGKMPLPIIESINNSIRSLDRFRNEAENRMIYTGVSKDTHIFTGK